MATSHYGEKEQKGEREKERKRERERKNNKTEQGCSYSPALMQMSILIPQLIRTQTKVEI